MRFKKLLIGAFIGGVSCGACAEAEWKYINTSDSGFIIGVDINNISNVSEYGYQQNKKFWSKQVVSTDLVQDDLAVGDHRMVLYWANCNAKTLGIKSITTYTKQKNGAYNPKTYTSPVVEMEDIIPDTMGDQILNAVC